jgi:hypothetical protein
VLRTSKQFLVVYLDGGNKPERVYVMVREFLSGIAGTFPKPHSMGISGV